MPVLDSRWKSLVFEYLPSTRFPKNHGCPYSSRHFQEFQDIAENKEEFEAKILDRGLPGCEAVLSIRHGARGIPEDRSS